jgi:hypothetical protein
MNKRSLPRVAVRAPMLIDGTARGMAQMGDVQNPIIEVQARSPRHAQPDAATSLG